MISGSGSSGGVGAGGVGVSGVGLGSESKKSKDSFVPSPTGGGAGGSLPAQADRLAFVEQWRAGRIVNGEMICDSAFRRSRETPDLPVWCLLPDGEGAPAVSVTDATGRRWVFVWQENV